MTRHSFLQLLIDGARVVSYEEVLTEALTAAENHDERDHLREERRRALQLRDLLELQRSRQEGQRALLECAKDLAELHSDVDTTLTSIVTRAQRLLDCDLAYLSLNDDERGETYVQVMVGATSSRWRDIRIPYGTGIGGKVAATAAPFMTADYFADEFIDHDPAVDTSARSEQQVAILGVPLVHHSKVIGVLYASNRTPGEFSHDSITLLSSFAALAAVAIDQATLLQDKETALVELHSVNQVLQRQSTDTERAVTAHDRSMDIVLRGGGVQEIVTATAESLDGALALFDELDTPVAWTAGTSEADLSVMLQAAQSSRRSGRRSGRSSELDAYWISGLVAGSEDLGALVWRPDPEQAPIAQPELRLLERAAVVASLLQLFNRNLGAAEARVRGELLEDLLSTTTVTHAAVAERAQRVGFQPEKSHVVVVAHVEPRRRPRLAAVAASTAAAQAGLSTTRDGFAVLVLPSDDPSLTARQLSSSMSMRIGAPITAGAAGPTHELGQLPAAYQEAAACTRALLRLEQPGSSATAAELGYTGLLLGESAAPQRFIARTLGPVIQHDQRRSTALLRTLEVYFATGQSLAKSAKQLHVHPNTVTQRLDRIKQLLGVDWANPDQALELQLALRLHRVLDDDAH